MNKELQTFLGLLRFLVSFTKHVRQQGIKKKNITWKINVVKKCFVSRSI